MLSFPQITYINGAIKLWNPVSSRYLTEEDACHVQSSPNRTTFANISRRRTPSPTIISIIQIHCNELLEFTFKPVQIVCSKLLSTSRTNFCQYATVEHHLLPLYQLFRFTLVLVQSGKVMGDGVYLTCVNCRQQPVVNFENQLMRMQVTFLGSGTFVSLFE